MIPAFLFDIFRKQCFNKSMERKVSIGLLTLIIFFSCVDLIQACRCVDKPSVSGIEFIGEVVEVAEVPKEGFREATFKLLKSIRGVKRESIMIRTRLSGAECGYDFIEGQVYHVFAESVGGELITGMCYGNKHYEGLITNEPHEKAGEINSPDIIIETIITE